MKMTVEEFYQAIRYVDVVRDNNDPIDLKDAEEQLDDKAYALSNHKMNKNTRFYLKQFINYKEKGKIISRNIPFILASTFWLAYRRIYWFIPIFTVIQFTSFFMFMAIFKPMDPNQNMFQNTVSFGYKVLSNQNLDIKELLYLFLFSIISNIIISPFVNYIYFWNTQRRLKKGHRSQRYGVFASIVITILFTLLVEYLMLIPYYIGLMFN